MKKLIAVVISGLFASAAFAAAPVPAEKAAVPAAEKAVPAAEKTDSTKCTQKAMPAKKAQKATMTGNQAKKDVKVESKVDAPAPAAKPAAK